MLCAHLCGWLESLCTIALTLLVSLNEESADFFFGFYINEANLPLIWL